MGLTGKHQNKTGYMNMNRAEFWKGQVSKMLESGEYGHAEEFLKDVLGHIRRMGLISDAQIRAVKNIKHGRNIKDS